jgi:acetolactate synthase-1/2/3 large subunit
MQGMHGHVASSMAQKEADLIIGVGVRFSDRATGNVAKFAKGTKIIQLDPDFAEINKNVNVDLGIIADVRDAFLRIAQKCEARKNISWEKAIEELKEKEAAIAKKAAQMAGDRMTPKMVFDVINANKLPRTIITTDVGQHQMWAAQYSKFDTTRRFVSSGGLGTMGFGLGAAMGAMVATKDPTILITGDGSFGMNLNELATAVTYNIPVVIVLMNNGVLGMVRQWQNLFFQKRFSNTVLQRRTDFVKLAEAFGAVGMRANTIGEFEEAFKKAIAQGGPVLIDTLIDKDEFVLPMLPPGGSIDEMIEKVGEEQK